VSRSTPAARSCSSFQPRAQDGSYVGSYCLHESGSGGGGVKGRDQVPVLVDRYLAGEIDLEPFVTHRIGLDEVNRGFELMEAQGGIRSVIEFV
jgi:Zn-dependent alcohol dehydrogenase